MLYDRFKIWHYSGSLIHERNIGTPDELWECAYQPFPDGTFKEFAVSAKKVVGIPPSQPQGFHFFNVVFFFYFMGLNVKHSFLI